MTLERQLTAYVPCNEQEERDLALMLDFLRGGKTPFSRENGMAHFSASAWVVNKTHDRVLMIWHNIYKSWSWTGGHADGETDLQAVARREAREETGIETLTDAGELPFSVEILTVDGHVKRGQYVPSHLHYNVTYLFEADDSQTVRVKPDENSGVGWFAPQEALDACSEPWMNERVYSKLLKKLNMI